MLPVEMTTRKTVMVLALVLVAALMVTALPALAGTNTKKSQATPKAAIARAAGRLRLYDEHANEAPQ